MSSVHDCDLPHAPTLPSRGSKKRALTSNDFLGKAAIFLPEQAHYDHLLALPGDKDLGAAIKTAMELIESNGNYLWIQYYHSYLEPTGRAGFVMASSASDAGHGEKEVREQIIATGDVDVMMAIGTNFFHTRSLPCTLWFFDQGKPAERKDQVLMIDARSLYRVISRKIRDFSEEQLKNLTAIAWLYRGEQDRYLKLVHEYFMQTCQEYLASLGFDLQHLIQAEGFDKLACLDKNNNDSAVNAVCTNDESLARFTVMARDVFKKKQSLITEPALTAPFKSQHDAIVAIYDQIHQQQELAIDLNAVLRSMHGVISEFVTVENQPHSSSPEPGKLYDLSQINFDRLKTEFEQSPTKKTQVQTLKEAVDQQLRRMLNQNSTRIDLCIRYQEIVANYNQETDRATIEQTFEQLLNFIESLSEEDSRAVREGLTEDNLTVFDLLCKQKENLSVQVRNRIKQVAQKLLESIQTELQRLENWRDKETTKAQVETSIYNYLYDEKTGLPTESYDDQEIAELSKVIFLHLYRQSPATNYPIYPNVA